MNQKKMQKQISRFFLIMFSFIGILLCVMGGVLHPPEDDEAKELQAMAFQKGSIALILAGASAFYLHFLTKANRS